MDLSILAQLVLSGILLGAIYALAAAGLNLIFGVMRVVNVAHGDLMMLGAYTTIFLYERFDLNPLLSLFISIPLLFAFGWLIQRALVNRVVNQPHLMSLILMWGMSLVIINAGLYFFTANTRAVPYLTGAIPLGDVALSRARGVAFVAAALISLAVWLFLQRSKWGKAIRAVAQSAEMARVCGINVERVRVVTFALASALAGAAGTLLITILAINPSVGPTFLLKGFAIIVVGGLGSFSGAFIGALVIGVLESLAAFFLDTQLAEVVIFFTLILFLLVRPGGIMGVEE